MFGESGLYYDIRAPLVSAEVVRDSWNIEPKGRPKFAEDWKVAVGAVAPRSPKELHDAVEWLAYFFKRESGYDFPQYESSDARDSQDDKLRAYVWADGLMLDERGRIPVFGAACFRWREYKKLPEGWAAQWIWFHPYMRRKGHLSQAWPYFEKRFGRIVAEPPYSPAMANFLKKRKAWPFDKSR